MAMQYVRTDASGWLRVRTKPGTEITLPQFLRVKFEGRHGNRDHFRVEEGVHAGVQASVAARSDADSWLGTPLPACKSPVSLVFRRGAGVLSTPIGELDAISDVVNPIPTGAHPIQMPDFQHDLGRG